MKTPLTFVFDILFKPYSFYWKLQCGVQQSSHFSKYHFQCSRLWQHQNAIHFTGMCILHCCRTPSWVKCVLFFGCDFLPYVLVLDPNAWSFTLFLFLHWTADSNVILCRDVLAVLKCAVSIHIFSLDAASVLWTYRKHGQALLYMIFTCMVFLWLYRPYYSYYYYYHTVPHTPTNIFQ